jgi:hypothetical protein
MRFRRSRSFFSRATFAIFWYLFTIAYRARVDANDGKRKPRTGWCGESPVWGDAAQMNNSCAILQARTWRPVTLFASLRACSGSGSRQTILKQSALSPYRQTILKQSVLSPYRPVVCALLLRGSRTSYSVHLPNELLRTYARYAITPKAWEEFSSHACG